MMCFARVHLVATLVFSAACDRPTAPNPPVTPASAPAPSPHEALEAMDSRKPVPLLPMMAQHQKENMRDHLVVVQEVVLALARDDFEAVAQAAARIGYSEKMEEMCSHMGAGAPGFTEQAVGFHRTADGIAAAAREKDRAKVLVELGATLETCTACHAAWKQELVDDVRWRSLTDLTPPSSSGHP